MNTAIDCGKYPSRSLSLLDSPDAVRAPASLDHQYTVRDRHWPCSIDVSFVSLYPQALELGLLNNHIPKVVVRNCCGRQDEVLAITTRAAGPVACL